MNIKKDRAMLWLEKKTGDLHRKRRIAALSLCLTAGLTASFFKTEMYSQILALVWITVAMVTANRNALSFYNGSLKQYLAAGGDAASAVVCKMYYPVIRMTAFLVTYTIAALAIMGITHYHPGVFLLRSLICILASPVVLGGITMVSLILREPVKILFNIFIIVIFNLLTIPERMFPAVYVIEVLTLSVMALGELALIKRLSGEKILSKGGR